VLSESELKLLRLFAQKHVIRACELKGNGSAALNLLLEKGLITKVSPLGETTYAITQKGLKLIQEMKENGEEI